MMFNHLVNVTMNKTINLINITDSTHNVNPDQEAPLSQFIGISVGLFAIMGLLGNSLVLTVMSIAPSKRLPNYRFLITHLSTYDLISSMLLILYTPLELHKHVWIYPEWFCPVLYPSITIAANLATGTILIIALEHYLGIVKPHWNQLSKSKVAVGLFAVWIWATVSVLPNIMSLRLSTGDYIFCGEFWDGHESMQKLYGLSFFFIAFFIPLSAIAYLYGHIIHQLRKSGVVQYHSTLEGTLSHNALPRNPDTRHAIHVLSLMIISFAICVSPNKILFFVYDVAPSAWNSHTHFYLRTIQVS